MSVRSKLAAFGKLLRGDSEKRWVVAERAARIAHPNAVLGEHAKSWRVDPDFAASVARLPANERYYDRLFALDQFARNAAEVDGGFAECGTYTGSSAWFLCRRAQDAGKSVALFDSWEGLATPAPEDGDYWQEHDLRASLAEAKQTLSEFTNADFYPGWIPTRFSEVADDRFALLHIDVDLYAATRDALEFFYPRMVPGGLIVCDDYGFESCPGARRALDEFGAANRQTVMHLPTGQALVVVASRNPE